MIREHAAEDVMDPHKTSYLGLNKSPIIIVWVIGHGMIQVQWASIKAQFLFLFFLLVFTLLLSGKTGFFS